MLQASDRSAQGAAFSSGPSPAMKLLRTQLAFDEEFGLEMGMFSGQRCG